MFTEKYNKIISFVLFILLNNAPIKEISGEIYFINENKIKYLKENLNDFGEVSDRLINVPGKYKFENSVYDLDEEGVYRYYNVPSENVQKIIYIDNIERFLHSLTWIHCHGYKDSLSPFNELLKIATKRRIQLTCGEFSLFVNKICSLNEIQSRFILLLTLEDWNSYNNGHSLNEIKINGEWQLWDLDQRNVFIKNGKKLNAFDFVLAVKENDYEIFKFSESPTLALSDLTSNCCSKNNYDYQFWNEGQFLKENNLRAFYNRCGQVLFIIENGLYYFICDEKDKSRVLLYYPNAYFLSESDFLNKFY